MRDELRLAGLAHDLNNVFQTLIGVALQTEDPAASAAILRAVERARHITGEMQNGQAAKVSLEAVLESATKSIEDGKTRVEASLEPGIQLSGWAWERVLVNLFQNSVRAMPGGGTIRVQALLRDGGVEISVADEGCGIPAALLDRLFEPHVSGNASTGLGLSIVSSIVKSQGGKIRASNRPEGGAEFVIRLPGQAAVAGA